MFVNFIFYFDDPCMKVKKYIYLKARVNWLSMGQFTMAVFIRGKDKDRGHKPFKMTIIFILEVFSMTRWAEKENCRYKSNNLINKSFKIGDSLFEG